VFEICLLPCVQKDLDKLERQSLDRIIKEIRSLSVQPRPHGCLKLTDEQGFRIRIGDFRVLYRIDDPVKRVIIYRIKNRKEAYRP